MKNLLNIQRTFILGDEWCYFKIYTGFKTADDILINIIYPLSQLLLQKNIIDKWFFIRYSDPEFHLRIRFHLQDLSNIGFLIINFNHVVKEYVHNDLIWKIQTDTYNRELERYGKENIESSESLFWQDSEMMVKTIMLLKSCPDKDMQWLMGLKIVDVLLDDFSFPLEDKHVLLQSMQEGFKKEFAINETYKRQFGKNYRAKRDQIEEILSKDVENIEKYQLYFAPVFEKSKKSENIILDIKWKISNNKNASMESLINSYIHMMLNRLFRMQQRMHELVLYDYLFRYYTSQLARLKQKS